MDPVKLGSTRGLTALRSKPAVLRGHRLAFNHRGGFGNLVQDGAHSVVHGVLHQFSAEHMAKLINMEHEYW